MFAMLMQVAHCGGISELHRLASYTETYDVAFAPHCPLGPIALAACMQVDLTAPNCESLPSLRLCTQSSCWDGRISCIASSSLHPGDELAGPYALSSQSRSS